MRNDIFATSTAGLKFPLDMLRCTRHYGENGGPHYIGGSGSEKNKDNSHGR